MKFYAVFYPPEQKGIYTTWDDCKAAIAGISSASYCSYRTVALAERALKTGSLKAAKIAESKARANIWIRAVTLPCLVVDAACSGCPGPVEYRGVVLSHGDTMIEVFRCGPFLDGTNNIGEFLAVIAGLKWLEGTSLTYDLYTDSATAIKWVKTLGFCNTKLPRIGRELAMQIRIAESWLRSPSSAKYLEKIRKWNTAEWGEIPADYARK